MSDREAVSLPWLGAGLALLAIVALALSALVAGASTDTAEDAPQAGVAAQDEAERLRYALTSANASAAIAADRAEALEREIALLDVTVGNLTDRLERATGAAVSIDASGAVTLEYPPEPQAEPEPAATSAPPTGSGWSSAKASWYGPGLYGNSTADGTTFTSDTWCVAHKDLPFGTVVEIAYGGKTVDVPVRDRGPYVAGREFDLSAAVARSLGFSGTGTIRWRVKP